MTYTDIYRYQFCLSYYTNICNIFLFIGQLITGNMPGTIRDNVKERCFHDPLKKMAIWANMKGQCLIGITTMNFRWILGK